MTFEEICDYLKNYDGEPIKIMEVCGSHTAAIAKFGIKGILSEKIKLVSGPGCPVCVTPSAYIDKLIEIAKEPGYTVATFGDLLRVPGSTESLSEAKGSGARAEMVYSPMDVLELAKANPEMTYVFAAVGFETTAPVYTLLMEEAEKQNLSNIKLLTSLKTMPGAIDSLLNKGAAIDGFLAPGHVCAITGSNYFKPLAEKHSVPFAVSGFGDRELMLSIYGLVKMIENKEYTVKNFYPAVVEDEMSPQAKEKLEKYYELDDAIWRGMGNIESSGLYIKEKYSHFDMGSHGLTEDVKRNSRCCCGAVLSGKMESKQCPLFGKECTPQTPQGACMVSYEGSCYQAYLN